MTNLRKAAVCGPILALILAGLFTSVLACPQATTEGGVTFSLEVEKISVSLHEPVRLELTVRNTRAENVYFDLGPDRKENIRLFITRPDGTLVASPALVPWGLARLGQISLTPGGAFRQKILLNEWYTFSKAGRYKIQLKIAGLSLRTATGTVLSDQVSLPPVVVEVGPYNEQALIESCRTLANGALHDPDYERRREDAVALSYFVDPVAIPYLAQLTNDRIYGGVAVIGLARIANVEGIERVLAELDRSDPNLKASIRKALRNMRSQAGHSH